MTTAPLVVALIVALIAMGFSVWRQYDQALTVTATRQILRDDRARAERLLAEREAARGEVLIMTALLASRDAMLTEMRRQLTDEIKLAAERLEETHADREEEPADAD